MHNKKIIQVKNLTKKFGSFTALKNLNFDILSNENFGLVGPNGAGKSTFISILSTICKPTCGDVFIQNVSIKKYPDKVRKSIGLVPQDIALYPSLTGMDNLDFWAGIYGLTGSMKKKRINRALEMVKLGEKAQDRVDSYSGGMKRRLNIAVALIHNPEILIMDEPTAGIDIQSRRYILEGIKFLKQEGRTIVFTTHYMEEMQYLCDRIGVIDRGSLKAIGTLKELQEEYGTQKIEDIMIKITENATTK